MHFYLKYVFLLYLFKESQAKNESIESQLKDGLVKFKNLLVDERSTSKINDKLHELMGRQKHTTS